MIVLPDSTRASELDAKQLEVLAMIGHGYTDASIAGHLHMCEQSVQYHIGRIRERLNLVTPPGMHPRAVLWLLASRWEAASAVANPVRATMTPARPMPSAS